MEQGRTNKRSLSISSMIVASGMVALLNLSIIAASIPIAAAQQQQQQQPGGGTPEGGAAASSTNAACGQVVSGVVNLTSNLNCSGDGIIVGGPNTVVNMNGFSITG
ncbi:MAG TPA: hypothetical protein VFG77_00155, partial [Nitrososphaeraceae archaeon]|nr:hypothetical protein [Nitrososphaeraceae archaeon]